MHTRVKYQEGSVRVDHSTSLYVVVAALVERRARLDGYLVSPHDPRDGALDQNRRSRRHRLVPEGFPGVAQPGFTVTAAPAADAARVA